MSIKKALNSNEAYDLLDTTNAKGCSWTSGGCFILAESLSFMFGFDIYIIVDSDKNIPHHFVVKTNRDTFLDYDGEVKHILRAFKNRESYVGNLKLIKYKNELDEWIKSFGIVKDSNASIKLSQIINNQNKSFPFIQ